MDPKHIDYQSRRLDVTLLKRVSSQGAVIDVHGAALHTVANIPHTELVVVATGQNRYDVLLGSWKEGMQKARLISKIVLKKADASPPAPSQEPQGRHSYEGPVDRDRVRQLQDRFGNDRRDNRYARY